MNDEKIINAIKDGDESAMNRVINKYSRLMWTVVSPILQNAASVQDIEECVADAFIYLWQNPSKYDPKKGKLKSWLSIVARSRAIERYRQAVKRDWFSLEDSEFVEQIDVVDGITNEQTKQTLFAAIGTLGHVDQEILVRRFFYGQKPREIAKAMDMPVKHVENRIYQTKLRLRNMITYQEGELK